MLREKRTLPCGCILYWDEEHILVAFCVTHPIDYMRWKGKVEDFIKIVTNTQTEIVYIDESILTKMK
jgi:hypothetical protein